MIVGILGDGLMATAISHLLKKNAVDHDILSRKNQNLEKIANYTTIFACVPSLVLIEFSEKLKNINVISCAKGIATNQNPFISSFFDANFFCVLSGPNFAYEILTNSKTITTIASKNLTFINDVKKMLENENFVIETTQNVNGVEICGIVKNIIAIVMGYISEKPWNEKAFFLTKMFQETVKILDFFQCNTDAINLSCGIGDIFLTCSTTNSRNFQFGVNLARNINCDQAQTIEGVRSAQFLKSLLFLQNSIELPTFKIFIEKIIK